MNQEKIGKFISECRKEKQLTQEQLAVQLGVTSKSISKWENGNTMPDVTMIRIKRKRHAWATYHKAGRIAQERPF